MWGWEVSFRSKSARIFLSTILVAFAALQLSACNRSDNNVSPAEPGQTLVLRAESELTTGCYEWPTPDLKLPDAVGYAMPLAVGDRAIEFTLADTDGATHKLSRMLETRPVLVVFGAFT